MSSRYIHFDNDNKDGDAKKPSANMPRDVRSIENWKYRKQLRNAEVTSPVQTSFQSKVIVLPGTLGMAELSEEQWNRLSPKEQKLREHVNPGRTNVVLDFESALSLGMSKDDVANSTLEELVERGVKILAVNYSRTALKDVVGGKWTHFGELVTRDVGNKATIHRGCMVVIFSDDIKVLLGLEAEVGEDAESRLAELRSNATDEAQGNVFISVLEPNSNRCLATFTSLTSAAAGTGISYGTIKDNVNKGTLDKLGEKHGVTIQRLKGRSEFEALEPIENGTEEMKSIMARNLKASPKTNPELKRKLEEHFAVWGEQAKDQTAFINGIEAMYGYSVRNTKDLLRDWWAKKTKVTKKNTGGNIKSFFTTTRK
jgi:hypothetical protein